MNATPDSMAALEASLRIIHEVEPANPWAGRIACPECASADWTMPVGALAPGAWRCCACHLQWRPLPTPVCHMAHTHHDREYEPCPPERCWALVRPAVQRGGNLS